MLVISVAVPRSRDDPVEVAGQACQAPKRLLTKALEHPT
jgi:hypothetical protein